MRTYGLVIIQILAIFSWPMNVIAAEKIGTIIIVRGSLVAIEKDKSKRVLKRRSPFYAGEVLKTSKNTTVKLKFTDKAIMSLRGETEFRVDSYVFNATDKSKNKIAMTLLKGGLRTVTGLIGKAKPSALSLRTPVASMGIRGTDMEVVLTPNGGINVAFWSGSGTLTNKAGTLSFGAGTGTKFAIVPTANTPPKGQTNQPSSMNNSVNPVPTKSEVLNVTNSTGDSGDSPSYGGTDLDTTGGTGADGGGGGVASPS